MLIVNAAALERSLYLLSELLLIGPPVVVAVNMIDVAEAQGIRINTKALQDALGVPVVPMIARKNIGLKELVSEVIALSEGDVAYHPRMPDVMQDHKHIFLKLMDLIRPYAPQSYMSHWIITKLMEGDPEVSSTVEQTLPADIWAKVRAVFMEHEDSLHAVVGGRYDWIEEVTRAAISRFKRGQVLRTDRIDHVLTRPIFGIPILLAVLAVVFMLTYEIGFPVQKWLEGAMSSLSRWLEPALGSAPFWLKGVVINGIIGGAGSVLTFLPILLIFFAVMALLEDIGYMARAAFVMDRFMHLIGLHGKSFIPMCLGFGCNVPAVLGARIIESRKARLLTILLTPFVPCTARLAVLTFVAGAVFTKNAAIVSWSVLAANIFILGLTGMLVNRLVMKDEAMPFIMELPLYHSPDPKTIGHVIWSRTIAFVTRAGTVILAVSIVIWLLSHLPEGNMQESILGLAGRWVAPAGALIGLDWKMIVALLTSLVAKENFDRNSRSPLRSRRRGAAVRTATGYEPGLCACLPGSFDAFRPLRSDSGRHAPRNEKQGMVCGLFSDHAGDFLPGRSCRLSSCVAPSPVVWSPCFLHKAILLICLNPAPNPELFHYFLRANFSEFCRRPQRNGPIIRPENHHEIEKRDRMKKMYILILLPILACLSAAALASSESGQLALKDVNPQEVYSYNSVPSGGGDAESIDIRVSNENGKKIYHSLTRTKGGKLDEVKVETDNAGQFTSGVSRITDPAGNRAEKLQGVALGQQDLPGRFLQTGISRRSRYPREWTPHWMDLSLFDPFLIESKKTSEEILLVTFSGKSVKLLVNDKGPESITVPAGQFVCRRIEVAVPVFYFIARITLWISQEAPYCS